MKPLSVVVIALASALMGACDEATCTCTPPQPLDAGPARDEPGRVDATVVTPLDSAQVLGFLSAVSQGQIQLNQAVLQRLPPGSEVHVFASASLESHVRAERRREGLLGSGRSSPEELAIRSEYAAALTDLEAAPSEELVLRFLALEVRLLGELMDRYAQVMQNLPPDRVLERELQRVSSELFEHFQLAERLYVGLLEFGSDPLQYGVDAGHGFDASVLIVDAAAMPELIRDASAPESAPDAGP